VSEQTLSAIDEIGLGPLTRSGWVQAARHPKSSVLVLSAAVLSAPLTWGRPPSGSSSRATHRLPSFAGSVTARLYVQRTELASPIVTSQLPFPLGPDAGRGQRSPEALSLTS
jgi:hypothetical protein